jgi:hypothetical protein
MCIVRYPWTAPPATLVNIFTTGGGNPPKSKHFWLKKLCQPASILVQVGCDVLRFKHLTTVQIVCDRTALFIVFCSIPIIQMMLSNRAGFQSTNQCNHKHMTVIGRLYCLTYTVLCVGDVSM